MSDGWNKVGGQSNADAWKPEKEGDKVEGKYIDQRDVTTKYGPAKVYILQKPDGVEVAVFGKANINRNMQNVELGDEVRIVYMGLEKNPKTGFSYKSFEVYNKKSVATADLKPTEKKDKDDVTPDDIPF